MQVAWQQSKAYSLSRIFGWKISQIPRYSWHTSKSNDFYLYVLQQYAAATGSIGHLFPFKQTGFSDYYFNPLHRVYELYISVPITYSIGVLHSIDYFSRASKTILMNRRDLPLQSFLSLRFYSQPSLEFLRSLEILRKFVG